MNLASRSYVILFFIVLLGIVGQWAGDALTHLWRYPAAAWILALIYEALLAKLSTHRIQLITDQHAALGKPLAITLVVYNPSHRPIELETMPDFPNNLLVKREISQWNIAGEELSKQTIMITPQCLGKINWQRLYTRSLGRLRLAWWNRCIELNQHLQVEPDHLHTDERRSGTQQQGDINQRSTGSGHELLGLREYQQGDPLRSIDWKATARSGKRTVRLFTEEQHLELMLCIDVGRTSGLQADNLTRLHHYANSAARLAEKAIINGDHVGLVIYADKVLVALPPLRGITALQKIRQQLELLKTIQCESNPLDSALRVRELVRQRSLVIMFGDIDENTAAQQLLRATQLLTPKHLPLLAGINDREIEALYSNLATQWLDPHYAFAASQSTHAQHKTVIQLRRLGAHVLTTFPEYLDKKLLHYYEDLRERRSV